MENLIYVCHGDLSDIDEIGIFPDIIIGKNYELITLFTGKDFDLDTGEFIDSFNSFGYYVREDDYNKVDFEYIILLNSFTLSADPKSDLFKLFIDRMKFEMMVAPNEKSLLH